MGVTGSKRSYTLGDAKQGTGLDSKGQFDKPEPGAEGPPPEESAADKKMMLVNRWKAFLTAIVEMKEAKDPLQKAVLTEKTVTNELTKKGVVIDKDAVKNFASGDGDYLPELILYLGEVGLKPNEGEQIKFNSAEALKISTEEAGQKGPKQTLKKEVKFSDVEKTFFLSIIDAARVAKKHTVFRKILKDYILETDSFKDAMKEENVLGAKDDIKAGKDGAVAKAKAEIKDKEKGKEPTAGGDDYVSEAGASEAEGGASDDECSDGGSYASVDGASMSGGSVSEASVSEASDYASISESSMSGGEEYEGGDDEDVEGGANIPGFRTPEEKIAKLNKKEYKKFKKEAYADFTKKQEAYFNDEVEMSKFMDANEGDLLQMVYDGKGTLVGKWINKSATGPKKAVAANLVAAINAYVEPVEGAPPAAAAPADGAAKPAEPAGAEGDKKDDKKEEAAKPAEPAGDAAKKEEKPAGAATEKKEGGDEPQEAVVEQGGGGGIKVNPKKKRHTRKKPQRINISINVGNKNVIDENSSDSDSSSSSSSSDSSSDDEDEEKEVKPIVHIKSKKHTRKRHNKA